MEEDILREEEEEVIPREGEGVEDMEVEALAVAALLVVEEAQVGEVEGEYTTPKKV